MNKGGNSVSLDLQGNKEKFIAIYKGEITREGANNLLDWLEKTDFFTAPLTGKYALSCSGGLCQHSINTYKVLSELVGKYREVDRNYLLSFDAPEGAVPGTPLYEHAREEAIKVTDESIAIIGLLHSICLVECWVEGVYNEQQPDGKWLKKPCFKWDERFLYGRGAKSVFIIQQFMRLYVEEAQAIRFYTQGKEVPYGESIESLFYQVYDTCPLAALTGVAVNEANNVLDQLVWAEHKPK